MILSTFLCSYCQSTYLPLRSAYSFALLILGYFGYFEKILVDLWEYFIYPRYQALIQCVQCEYFFHLLSFLVLVLTHISWPCRNSLMWCRPICLFLLPLLLHSLMKLSGIHSLTQSWGSLTGAESPLAEEGHPGMMGSRTHSTELPMWLTRWSLMSRAS